MKIAGRPRTTTHAQPAAKSASPRTVTSEKPRTDRYEHGATPSSARVPASTPGPRSFAEALRSARLVRRGDGNVGIETVVTAHDEKRLRAVLARVPPTLRARIESIVLSPSGDSAPAARALLLKALSARAERLGVDGQAPAEVERFATKLSGLDADEMLRRCSALDLDATRNTSTLNPTMLDENRGWIRDATGKDTVASNDGLIQRFTATCGPTTLQMLLAEADPVFAFAMHEAGIASDGTEDAAARFQRAVLETYDGGAAVGRREKLLWTRLNNALGNLSLDDETAENLRAQLQRGNGLDQRSKRALDELRARYDGFPNDAEVRRMSGSAPRADEGLGFDQFKSALAGHASPVTGMAYAQTPPPDGFARGQAWRHLDDVESVLRKGLDVPFGLAEPGHWMLLSAVKGRKPARNFLVSDPSSGRTEWVRERDFVHGAFADKQFHLPRKGERPYVDSFFLPEAPHG